MENKKILIFGAAGIGLAYLFYKRRQKQNEYNNLISQKNKAQLIDSVEKDAGTRRKTQNVISYKEDSPIVLKWKNIINYWADIDILDDQDSFYDAKTLEITQDIMDRTPVLQNYEHGQIDVEFIDNADNLFKTVNGKQDIELLPKRTFSSVFSSAPLGSPSIPEEQSGLSVSPFPRLAEPLPIAPGPRRARG